jgi:hypothetical protein
MTIDATDYEPRAADDFHAAALLPGFSNDLADAAERDLPRYFSFIKAAFAPELCHQLGCEFSELPHG